VALARDSTADELAAPVEAKIAGRELPAATEGPAVMPQLLDDLKESVQALNAGRRYCSFVFRTRPDRLVAAMMR
jgi:hypothetical protein